MSDTAMFTRFLKILSLTLAAGLCAAAVTYYGQEPGVEAAQGMAAVGESVGAEEQLLNVLEANPFDVAAWQRLAEILEEDGRLEPSLVAYQKAAAIEPDVVSHAVNVARIFLRMRRVQEAKEVVQGILSKSPFHPEALKIAGWLSLNSAAENSLSLDGFAPNRADIQTADTFFQAVLRVEPDDVEALVGRAVSAHWLGDPLFAEKHLDKATTIDSEAFWPWQLLGNILSDIGRFDEAATAYENAAAVGAKPYPWAGLAELARAAGDLPAAAIFSRRSGPSGFFAEGLNFLKAGRYAEAEEALLRSLRDRPADPVAIYYLEETRINLYPADDLKRVELAMRRLDEGRAAQQEWNVLLAYRSFRRAIRLAPQLSEARLTAARFFEKIGFYSASVKELRRVEELTRSQNERLIASDLLERITRQALTEIEEVHGVNFEELWALPTSELALIIGETARLDDAIKWGLTSVPEPRMKIAVFPFEEAVPPVHQNIGEYVSENLRTYLELLPGLELVSPEEINRAIITTGTRGGDRITAARLATEINADLTVSGRVFERPGDVAAEYFSVVSPEGPLLQNVRLIDQQSVPMNDVVLELARRLADFIPLEGRVLRKGANTLTTNLGRIHGVEPGDSLVVMRRENDYMLPGLDWPGEKERSLSTATVTAVTEHFSEIAVTDQTANINAGDLVKLDTRSAATGKSTDARILELAARKPAE